MGKYPMAQATLSCPFGAIHLEDRRGTAPDEHKVLIWSRPRRRFGDFAAAGKVTRRPQAAKPPCANDTPKTARRGRGPGQLLLPLRGNLPSRALQSFSNDACP